MSIDCNQRTCTHKKWDDRHCAEMACSNYVNKCPEHSIRFVRSSG